MKKYLITPKRGKPSMAKTPSKVPKPQKKPKAAPALSDYKGDDHGGLMDYNERESPRAARPPTPEFDELPPVPPRPEGNDITSDEFKRYFASAFDECSFTSAKLCMQVNALTK